MSDLPAFTGCHRLPVHSIAASRGDSTTRAGNTAQQGQATQHNQDRQHSATRTGKTAESSSDTCADTVPGVLPRLPGRRHAARRLRPPGLQGLLANVPHRLAQGRLSSHAPHMRWGRRVPRHHAHGGAARSRECGAARGVGSVRARAVGRQQCPRGVVPSTELWPRCTLLQAAAQSSPVCSLLTATDVDDGDVEYDRTTPTHTSGQLARVHSACAAAVRRSRLPSHSTPSLLCACALWLAAFGPFQDLYRSSATSEALTVWPWKRENG